MTWPTTQTTNSLDADGDTLQNARPEVKGLADKFNLLVAHVTTFMQGLLSSATAADARTTLDVPSRNGAGATGTSWGIGITGNAATATTAANVNRSVTGAGLATGGGLLDADRAITVTEATEADANTGAGTGVVTARRLPAAIAALAPASFVGAQVALGVGAVGSYAFCQGVTASAGAVIAGSSLRFADRAGGTSTSVYPAGSWRCMGVATVTDRATLFLRIA